MNRLIIITLIVSLFILSGCSNKPEQGVYGKIEYGEGDCFPCTRDCPEKEYSVLKNGIIFFIPEKDLELFFTNPDKYGIKVNTNLKGEYSINLDPMTYIITEENVFSDHYTNVTVQENKLVKLNKKFFKCTSY